MSNEDLATLIKQGVDRERNLELLYGNVRGFIIKSAKRYSGLAEIDDLVQEGYC